MGDVESDGEAIEEDLHGDTEGEAGHYHHLDADVGGGNELEDAGAYAARGFVPKCFHDPPDERMRSLEDYKACWEAGLAKHSRVVPGDFHRDNLVPKPIPALWQDCPQVRGFDVLKTDDAISRLSVCRPYSAIEQANCAGGISRTRVYPTSTLCSEC